MTGEEMLQEIERREYYAERERKNAELIALWWYVVQWTVIGCCVYSIYGHVRELLAVL